MVPPKNIFGNETGDFVLRGNCYHDCFKDADAEINLHSIIEFGSKNVEKMKILKLTNGKMHKPCENCKRSRFDIHLTPINFFGFFVQNSPIRVKVFFQTMQVTHLFLMKIMLTLSTNHLE